jgi:hypothetical protein
VLPVMAETISPNSIPSSTFSPHMCLPALLVDTESTARRNRTRSAADYGRMGEQYMKLARGRDRCDYCGRVLGCMDECREVGQSIQEQLMQHRHNPEGVGASATPTGGVPFSAHVIHEGDHRGYLAGSRHAGHIRHDVASLPTCPYKGLLKCAVQQLWSQ